MEKQNIEKILNDEISQAKQEAERLRTARTTNTMMDGDEWSAVELAEKLKLAEEELVQVSAYIFVQTCRLVQMNIQSFTEPIRGALRKIVSCASFVMNILQSPVIIG